MTRHTYRDTVQLDSEWASPCWEIVIEYSYIPAVPAIYAYSGGAMPQAPEGASVEMGEVYWRRLEYFRGKYRPNCEFYLMPEELYHTFGISEENDRLVDLLLENAEGER